MQVTEVIIVKFVPIFRDMYFCTSVAVISKYYLAFVKKILDYHNFLFSESRRNRTSR
jgi:hypothetical protein